MLKTILMLEPKIPNNYLSKDIFTVRCLPLVCQNNARTMKIPVKPHQFLTGGVTNNLIWKQKYSRKKIGPITYTETTLSF